MRFQTALSGELFELLLQVIACWRAMAARPKRRVAALVAGTGSSARQNPQSDLLHLLFSTRSRVVTGEMAKGDDASSYLSGLILGKDVATAHAALFGLERHRASGLYAVSWRRFIPCALGDYGVAAALVDGDRCVALAGLDACPCRKLSPCRLMPCSPNCPWSPSCAA